MAPWPSKDHDAAGCRGRRRRRALGRLPPAMRAPIGAGATGAVTAGGSRRGGGRIGRGGTAKQPAVDRHVRAAASLALPARGRPRPYRARPAAAAGSRTTTSAPSSKPNTVRNTGRVNWSQPSRRRAIAGSAEGRVDAVDVPGQPGRGGLRQAVEHRLRIDLERAADAGGQRAHEHGVGQQRRSGLLPAPRACAPAPSAQPPGPPRAGPPLRARDATAPAVSDRWPPAGRQPRLPVPLHSSKAPRSYAAASRDCGKRLLQLLAPAGCIATRSFRRRSTLMPSHSVSALASSAVVQAPDVELGAREIAALVQQAGQVVAGDGVARIQLVGARQAALGFGHAAGPCLAQALGHQRLGAARHTAGSPSPRRTRAAPRRSGPAGTAASRSCAARWRRAD